MVKQNHSTAIAMAAALLAFTAGVDVGYQITYKPVKPIVVAESMSSAAPLLTVRNTAVSTMDKQYTYYDVPLSDELQEYIQDMCDRYGFPHSDIVIALIGHESGYQADTISPTDDYGLMQINSINHGWMSEKLDVTDFLDERENIKCGVYLLGRLYQKYGSVELTLTVYGVGERGAQKMFERGTYISKGAREIIGAAVSLPKRRV